MFYKGLIWILNLANLLLSVGYNGSGKSTFVNLINGMYFPTKGRILIDKILTDKFMLEQLRKNIGLVSHDSVLFSDTLKNNIVIAKPNATEQEVLIAAKISKIDDFVRTLPKGYDTHLDADFLNLSTGQKQRIAIARMLITNPQIMIFDEATNAIDLMNESAIWDNILKYYSGKTLIVITHRLYSVTRAHKIFFIQNGVIKSSGSHQELLHRCSDYRTLWDYQIKNIVPNNINEFV